jgi:hypothetical protein
MLFRLTLMETLPANPPAALQVRFTYRNGTPPTTWPVSAVGPDFDTAVLVVNCAANLLNVPDVATRTLIAHYPHAPFTRDFAISSVQMPLADDDAAETVQATPYSVDIAMNQDTVTALKEGRFVLYGFKAVKTSGAGAPLVWFDYSNYGLNTELAWSEQYQAYTSLSKIISGGEITTTNPYDIDLGNTLNVDGDTGTGYVDTLHGVPQAISIHNETNTQFTCGISQTAPGGGTAPMCAFNLFGGSLDVIAPIEQILLMFSSTPVNTGTVIYQAYSRGLMIDLTGENSRSVGYDVNLGWSWDGGPWGKQVKANEALAPLLIQSSPSLARRQLASVGAR